MPDFGNLEQDAESEAKSHSQQVDEGITKADQEADKDAGGDDHGMIDKLAGDAKNDVGGSATPTPS